LAIALLQFGSPNIPETGARRSYHGPVTPACHPGYAEREAPDNEKLGYGPGNRLKVKVMTRDLAHFRDPAVLLIDQLKEVYIDGDLEPVDTTNYFPRVLRKDSSAHVKAATSPAPRTSPPSSGYDIVVAQLRSRLATKQSLNGQAEFGLAFRLLRE
jgi:hypothetical protein